MLTPEEIERRKPLWQSLSDLWSVDYEFDQTATNNLKKEVLSATHSPAELESVFSAYEDYDTHIARAMILSGYSLDEIEKILSEEVAPVVYSNLLSMTGEWAGFDSKWLCQKIVKNIKKTESIFFYRKWIQSSAGKFLMTKMTQEEWKILLKTYKTKLEEK